MTRAPRRLTFSVTVVSLGTGSSESEISAGNICAIRRSDRRLGMGSATTPRRRPEGAGWPHELPHYTCRPDNAENQSGVDTILESLNTSVCGYGSHNLPPFFMDGSATTNPSHGMPADGGPIRVARSYDAPGNLVCMEQHGRDFLIVNWGISLIVGSSLSTYTPFLGTYVERSFVAGGTLCLASAQCSAVRCPVCPGP